jgi:hypothetical protein
VANKGQTSLVFPTMGRLIKEQNGQAIQTRERRIHLLQAFVEALSILIPETATTVVYHVHSS